MLYKNIRLLTSYPINQTSLVNTTLNASDGYYILNVSTADASAISANATVNFTIDTLNPSINFTATLSNQIFVNQNYISINITLTETNLANITYYLWNGTSALSLYNETNFTYQNLSINFTNLSSDLYFFNVTIRDRADNINSTETRQISLNTRAPSARRFIITNSAGSNIASIDDKGDMYLLGNRTQGLTSISPTTASFIVQNSSGNAIAYINSTGYLFLKGTTTEDAGITLTGTNLEIRDSNDRVVAVIDNQGNLKLIGLLVEKFTNP